MDDDGDNDVVGEPAWKVALRKANRVRDERSRLRQMLSAGELTLEEAICDPAAEKMDVEDLLRAQKFWGRARMRKALNAAGVVGSTGMALEKKLIGTLSERQISSIVEYAERSEREREAGR